MKIKIEIEIDTNEDRDELEDLIVQLEQFKETLAGIQGSDDND